MEEQKKSRREAFGERLKQKYPEKTFDDDETLFGQIDDDYTAYDDELGKYKDRESRFTELLSKDPRAARFITDMADGKDPWISVVERLGIDGVTDLMNDPEKQEAYAEANKKYVERLAKEKTLEEEYRKNLSESMASLEAMQKERGLSDETLDAAMDVVFRIANDAILGKYSPETVEMALKVVQHDADVENARTEGNVAGRNAKIEERLRKPSAGDGQPVLAGRNNAPKKNKSNMSMFDLADDAR